MPSITETAEVGVDSGTLWTEIGDFGAVGRWHPWLQALEIDDDRRGCIRIANPGTQSEQVERLQSADSGRHCYRYTIERTSMPVRDYVGELRVEPLSASASRVVWTARFELASEGDGRTVEAVRHFLHAGTENLRARYGTQIQPEPPGVEHDIAAADQRARTGTDREPVRGSPPAGAWNDTSSD